MLAALLTAVVLGLQLPENEAGKYLFAGGFAYSLGREMPVCEKPVKHVYVNRAAPFALLQGTDELHLFNAPEGVCKKVYSLAGASEVQATLGDHFGVLQLVVDSTPQVVQITFDGKSKLIAQNARAVTTADGSRTAVLFNNSRTFAILEKDGRFGNQIDLPEGAHLDLQPNGEFAERESGERFVYSKTTGDWIPTTDRPSFKFPEGPGAAVTGSKVVGRHFEKDLLSAILMADAHNSTAPLLIAAGVDAVYKVAERAILIQRGAALTMRKLIKEPAATAIKRIADWEQADATKAAEDMARHFKIYAAGHGGAFPERGANLDREFFESSREGGPDPRFIYEFAGGVPKENLSNVLLGYIPTPSGRADLYADGTVKWVPRN